jgi:hypothetical protein
MATDWVSPRWKSAEPWVRAKMPTSISIGRISVGPRPSARMPFSVRSFCATFFYNRRNASAACSLRFSAFLNSP